MDLYYQWEPSFGHGYGPPTTQEAAAHLSAAAARLAYSIVLAIPNLPAATREEFLGLMSVESLWALAFVFSGWLITTVLGGPLGVAVNLLLILYGVASLWEEIKHLAGEVKAWARAAHDAKSETELEQAGKHFARALTGGLLTVIEVLVTHRTFRAIEKKIKKHYPPPRDLQREYEKAVQRSRVKATLEKTVGEKAVRTAEKIKKAGETIASGARGQGMRRAADDLPSPEFPSVELAVAAGVVVVGAGIGLALAFGSGDKK